MRKVIIENMKGIQKRSLPLENKPICAHGKSQQGKCGKKNVEKKLQ